VNDKIGLGRERTINKVDHVSHALALQLRFLKVSESMGNHDSKIVDAGGVD
jgi:hypothetical protein